MVRVDLDDGGAPNCSQESVAIVDWYDVSTSRAEFLTRPHERRGHRQLLPPDVWVLRHGVGAVLRNRLKACSRPDSAVHVLELVAMRAIPVVGPGVDEALRPHDSHVLVD